MNAQLKMKLIQCQPVRTITAPRRTKAAKLRLLGHGIDAIVMHTRRPAWGFLRYLMRGRNDVKLPAPPDPERRLHRYRAAMRLHQAGMLRGLLEC